MAAALKLLTFEGFKFRTLFCHGHFHASLITGVNQLLAGGNFSVVSKKREKYTATKIGYFTEICVKSKHFK